MAVTTTTLAAACGANDSYIVVTSATGFAVGNVIFVDGEWMVQTAAAVSTTIGVRRGGQNGSIQSAHPILSACMTALPSDIPANQPGWSTGPAIYKKQIVSYGASGAITPPVYDTIIYLNKATAAAMTLASPTAGTPDGVEVTFVSNTAAAHTITYTPGFNGDTTSSDVATFPATIGNSLTMLSAKGLWALKCVYGVTVG